jgi:hypothetical protein
MKISLFKVTWDFGWEGLTVASGHKVFKTKLEAESYIKIVQSTSSALGLRYDSFHKDIEEVSTDD